MDRKASIAVIGYPKIISQCQKVAEEYASATDVFYYQYLPESNEVQYVSGPPQAPAPEDYTAKDIIIAGRDTAKAIPQVDPAKIIPFRAGPKAILKALIRAKALSHRVAFICPVEQKHDIEFYGSLVDIDIEIFHTSGIQDYRPICARARENGHTVVISGSYTHKIAREYGLTPIFLFSETEIYHEVFTRALELHGYTQSLEEKISLLEVIAQKGEDTLIFLDTDRRIQFIKNLEQLNPGLKSQAFTGKPVSAIIEGIDPARLSPSKEKEIIHTIAGEEVLITIHPVQTAFQQAGTALFIRKTQRITALDSRVRKQIRHGKFKARYQFDDILGHSPAIRRCKEEAMRYAASQAPILLYGKTGTGKELFAQSIHNHSSRKHFPFVAINCATLPSELMESELFGYVKGAFSGARAQGKQGLVDKAHRGTLFLDEVDSLPMALQPKLLRLLQEKEFIRVGGDELTPVDIRIIAACNQRQTQADATQPLRRDLFYRLSVLYLELPELNHRQEDIPLLFNHFLTQADAPNVQIPAAQIMDVLAHRPMEGNLRELQSIATRFACLCDPETLSGAPQVTALLQNCCTPGQAPSPATGYPSDATLSELMDLAEKDILSWSQAQCNHSIQCMSKQLGIARSTLWRKLKRHGMGSAG